MSPSPKPNPDVTADPRVSPCTGVCVLDADGGVCSGCARTGQEIAGWAEATPASRAATWAALPGRRAALGLALHRLAWGPADLARFARRSVDQRDGTWVLGVPGALAEFSAAVDEPAVVDVVGRAVTVVTSRGALRLVVTDTTRALALDGSGGPSPTGGHRPMIVMVTPRPGNGPGGRAGVTALGPDRGAVRAVDRVGQLFDLGVGSAVARFCVRTTDPPLLDRLLRAESRPWSELVARSGELLIEVSPTRVVETALGRVEVTTPIPPAGGRSPEGPHTHLLAEHLAAGRDAPPGIDPPPTWAPAAIWYPEPPPEGIITPAPPTATGAPQPAPGGSASFEERVVSPAHQRPTPRAVGDVALGALSQVALDVGHHLAHLGHVVVGQVGLALPLEVDDPSAGGVTG